MSTEDELQRRARQGDEAAFTELFETYHALTLNVCYRLLGQRQAAEDATQEAFVSAWRNLRSLKGAFRPWVLRIASNAAHDELRRQGRRPQTSLDKAFEEGMPEPPDDEPSPEGSLLSAETRARIWAALGSLPEDQRQAIVLYDVDGLDYKEIAVVMRCSLGTVKSRIGRGRARLRVLLAAEWEPARGAGRQG